MRQGYTNEGQVLGASVGLGGTSQTIELNWRRGNNHIGMSAERRLHNNDFYVYSFTNSGDLRRFFVGFANILVDLSLVNGIWVHESVISNPIIIIGIYFNPRIFILCAEKTFNNLQPN